MPYLRLNYLASVAKRLIPKWAKHWQHPEQIPEFRNWFAEVSAAERERCLEACRRVGWRLWLAFHTDDDYERDWLLFDARRINAEYSARVVLATDSGDDMVEIVPEDNPLDSLIRFVQRTLVKRMAVCKRTHCERKYYFREPGRKGRRQKYCGLKCSETVNRTGKLRWYHLSPHSRKNRNAARRGAKIGG
jgi:hypothetical protein